MPKTDREMVKGELKRHDSLRQRRNQFENHWEDLSQVMLTRREGFTSTLVDGDQRNDDIYDGTPMQGARSLANTTGAMIRPEGEVFTTIKIENKDIGEQEEAAVWLADATERMDNAIRSPKARFRQTTGEIDLDLVVFGTGILSTMLSQSRENLIFQGTHLKDGVPFFSEEGHAVGMYRRRPMMLWQAVEKFKVENLHGDTQKLVK